MSFFIRKQEGGSRPVNKLGNTDAKKRFVRPNKNKFDNKRKFQSNFKTNGVEYKKPKYNEEISSGSEESDLEDRNEETLLDEEEIETAQEKKVRLAKLYLEEIEREEKQRAEDAEVDEECISKRLQDDVLEAEGRLKKEVADKLQVNLEGIRLLRYPKHLKKSVTCLAISADEEFIYSGCKNGNIFKWSISEGKQVGMIKCLVKLTKRKAKKGVVITSDGNSTHSSTVTCIAVSSDGKFLATGDMDNQIVIWNPDTLKRIHIFRGHRKPIRGLVFRRKTHTLYSAADDRTVRIWSLDEMGYVETLFGHQDSVTSIDALSRERAISSGGRDGTVRVWKIAEESQLVYNGHPNGSIDAVKMINEESFVSASDDGSISVWNVNRKKPLVTIEKAHGLGGDAMQPRWISAIASFTNTDLIASGSSDGFIRFWKCGERLKSLTEVFTVPCEGWINSIEFSASGKFLVVGLGKEHRYGRWFQEKAGKSSVAIIPLVKK